MLSEKTKEDIKKFEDAGIDVVAVSNSGKLTYATTGLGNTDEYCDQCPDFRLAPDPDPFDSFRDGDQKAICDAVCGVICGGLERPSEWTNIRKPLYCPKLGRELTNEEKAVAAERLEWAQKRMKDD